MKRREVIKSLTLFPLAGGIMANTPLKSISTVVMSDKKEGLFKELGIRPLINATGTMTFLSGSLMLPEVIEAINSTSHDFANLNEVEDKVGEKIAEMLNCEAAMVTAGAASALTVGTAATITGTDKDMIKLLPNLPGPQREVIIQKSHRYVFDHAVRNNGIKLVEIEGPQQMKDAFNENTVMALYFNAAGKSSVTHEQFIAIAKQHNIPTFIDAAADVPPKENLFKFQKMGFDLITFSGGKMLRAPQSTGLLLGRKDLIEAAKLNFDPNECPIGRPQKVNKEEMFGMYAALKSYLERDHDKEWQMWIDRTKQIAGYVEKIPTVKGETHINPGPANAFPGLNISWDQNKVKITVPQVLDALRKGDPRIEAGGRGATLHIAVVTLRPDQVSIVARRVKTILEQAV